MLHSLAEHARRPIEIDSDDAACPRSRPLVLRIVAAVLRRHDRPPHRAITVTRHGRRCRSASDRPAATMLRPMTYVTE